MITKKMFVLLTIMLFGSPLSYFLYSDRSEIRIVITINLVLSLLLFLVILRSYFTGTGNGQFILNRKSEGYYKTLFENNPSPFFLVDKDGKVTGTNQAVLNLLNYKTADLESKEFWKLFDDEEDLLLIKDHFEVAREGKARTFLGKIAKKDGNPIEMQFKMIPIKDTGFIIIGNDVTELIRYKERIVKTQIELRNTVRQQQGMIFKFIKKGDTFIHTLCDGELVNKLGLSSKNIVGKSLHDFLSRKNADEKLYHYNKAWSGQVTSYEGEANGTSYLASLSPVFKDGKVIEVIGSCIDISVRKSMEEELRKNERLYRTVLTTMSDGIFLINKSRMITNLNVNVERILGIRSGVFNESTMRELDIEFVKEDGTLIAYADLPGILSEDKGAPVSDAIMGFKEGGHIKKWISVNATSLFLPNEEQASLVSFYDISLQKEQELKLREANTFNQILLDNIRIGILVVDTGSKILLMNKALKEIIGIDPDKDVIGIQAEKFHYAFANTQNFDEMIVEIATERVPKTINVESKSGSVYRLNYVPILTENKGKASLWTFEDITKISKLQESALKAKEEAISANMAKSDFLSKMSHELRTPLNGILGFSQLLELEKTIDERQQKFVKEILKSGEHLLNLINDILDISRIESGKIKIEIETVNLTGLLSESVEMIGPLAEKRNIEIINQIGKGNDICVKADAVRLRQVMLNLLDNAIKYNEEYGMVEIYLELDEDDITVFIKDTGIGFNDEEAADIFKLFYRINGTNAEGSGIGLSLTKQLVQIMGGTIGATSIKGEGSTFWFSLPIYNDQASGQEKGEYIIQDHEERKELPQRRILYIEDNHSNIDLVKEIIETQMNHSLLYATTGAEGLHKANTENIHLILLDMNLPDFSGYQILEELNMQQLTKNIPVIALSANAISKDIKKAMDSGFDDYITKPININHFLTNINKYL
ncbi:PAS domain S-box protein [Bacillus sp. CECT 9360]|uniref:PAS domain S-box protein n=1 Tax=Bacillus sp. CECT 9360 TaxID=2845821 RepID=UPI001E3B5CB5|nr:PAS domain S-box protein [Bacillus sp. CECT 9360]CAH0346415.1 Sensor histidine kinase RcsC [Bacillus sp. CECT 9360]